MTEHKSVSLADCVFDKLENDILSGKYPYGKVLTESRLSEELQVSRTPVREAIRRLEQEDLVRVTGKGLVVQGITKEDIKDIFEIRIRIEGIAAAYSAKRMTDEQKAKLKEILDLQEFYVTKTDAEHVQYQDREFHEIIYAGCGSVALQSTLVPLHRKSQKYRRDSVEKQMRAEASSKEHQAIYKAIAAGDAKKADELMVLHIKNALKSILGEASGKV